MKKQKISIKDRLLRSIKIDSNNCWIWQLGKDRDGYGRIKIDGKYVRTHRVAYEIFNGSFNKNQLVCHKCDNPSCINPKHLYVGTLESNMFDKVRRNRVKGIKHPKALKKINKMFIEATKLLYKNKFSQQTIADLFGVHQGRISEILHNKHWSTR